MASVKVQELKLHLSSLCKWRILVGEVDWFLSRWNMQMVWLFWRGGSRVQDVQRWNKHRANLFVISKLHFSSLDLNGYIMAITIQKTKVINCTFCWLVQHRLIKNIIALEYLNLPKYEQFTIYESRCFIYLLETQRHLLIWTSCLQFWKKFHSLFLQILLLQYFFYQFILKLLIIINWILSVCLPCLLVARLPFLFFVLCAAF